MYEIQKLKEGEEKTWRYTSLDSCRIHIPDSNAKFLKLHLIGKNLETLTILGMPRKIDIEELSLHLRTSDVQLKVD